MGKIPLDIILWTFLQCAKVQGPFFDFLDFRAGLVLDNGLWTWDRQNKNE